VYPSPTAAHYHEQSSKLLEFLGLVIGKAIFEGIVVDPCFAPFFLAKLLGKTNSYYDLQSLDPELFANLQRLKSYDGNVSDLCLTFVATTEDGREVPLEPGGANREVTNENRYRYIYLLSDYKLNVELRAASTAFLTGFRKLVDERWLRMFGEDELQQVISGAKADGGVDVSDLEKNSQYSACSPRDKFVLDFWQAMRAMSPEHRRKLLRFVTSCSRTPLLGFSHLQPPFTLHKVAVTSDSEKLPMASTCFNALKLPAYSSAKVMKQKLEFVVDLGAGFELD
jgi:ubiquitin-protein ligase E3 C